MPEETYKVALPSLTTLTIYLFQYRLSTTNKDSDNI
jgi:hypothetical protein